MQISVRIHLLELERTILRAIDIESINRAVKLSQGHRCSVNPLKF